MQSRERILAALNGQPQDHVPLTTWCFGFKPDPSLRWPSEPVRRLAEPIRRLAEPVRTYWYSLRMEHIHTLPQPWTLEDDFARVLAWQSLGVDDILDVSVPWSCHPEVTWTDSILPAESENASPIAERTYLTPAGELKHAVRLTGEEPAPGWVVQPRTVPLFEDFNIPRGVRHAVSSPDHIAAIRYLYQGPDDRARFWFQERMQQVRAFAAEYQVAVQVWSAFGMDGVVWLSGVQNAVLLAMENPVEFGALVDSVFAADYARTELALVTPGVDIIVQRGWYSSTDFWSPRLFDRYVVPHLVELAHLTHGHGKKLAYVMTTGVEKLGPRLAEAGVDLLYFVDPVQDRLSLDWARQHLSDHMTLAGGVNALTLGSGNAQLIRQEARHALETLGPTRRFILHPLDAIFPDTPWEGMETLIQAWKETF
jgi:hypothetical protein